MVYGLHFSSASIWKKDFSYSVAAVGKISTDSASSTALRLLTVQKGKPKKPAESDEVLACVQRFRSINNNEIIIMQHGEDSVTEIDMSAGAFHLFI